MPRPLPEACAKLEARLQVSPDGETTSQSAHRAVEARAYRIDRRWVGVTVAEAERRIPQGIRAFVPQFRRGGEIITATAGLRLKEGDIAVLAGLRGFLVEHASNFGEEVDDQTLLDIPVDTVDLVVTQHSASAKRCLNSAGFPKPGLFSCDASCVRARRYQFMVGCDEPGDVLTVVGASKHVTDAASLIGYADWPTSATDMVFVGTFIFLGGLIGIPALKLGAFELGLGVSVGTLLGGLIAGWLRARRRTFGFVPSAALWLFDSVGLSAFIACVGISAGPSFVAGLVQSGPTLILISIIVVVLAHGSAILVGSRILNEGVLLGTCCGAGTSAPALAAVQEVAKSKIPALV